MMHHNTRRMMFALALVGTAAGSVVSALLYDSPHYGGGIVASAASTVILSPVLSVISLLSAFTPSSLHYESSFPIRFFVIFGFILALISYGCRRRFAYPIPQVFVLIGTAAWAAHNSTIFQNALGI